MEERGGFTSGLNIGTSSKMCSCNQEGPVVWLLPVGHVCPKVVIVGLCFEPLPPHQKKNVSLRGAGADKNEGRGEGPPLQKKNVSLRGAGVDLPECQERQCSTCSFVRAFARRRCA